MNRNNKNNNQKNNLKILIYREILLKIANINKIARIIDKIIQKIIKKKIITIKDKKRLIILYLTYPLLIMSCYNLSISLYTVKYTWKALYNGLFILLSALIISYFSKPELYFDIDDKRRYLIIGLVFLLFPSKIILEYQLWHLLPRSPWNFTL